MRADGHAPRALAENSHFPSIASKVLDEPLDPFQRILLVLQGQICVSRLRRVEVPQRAKTVLNARADDRLAIGHGLRDHERGAVLFVDAAEDEAAAVDIHQDGEFLCAGRFEDMKWYVELQD